jgi:hypothetical protein
MTLRFPLSAWVGPRRAARVLRVSAYQVELWLAAGSLPWTRKFPGRHRIIRVADLVAFADRNGRGVLVDAAGLRAPVLRRRAVRG